MELHDFFLLHVRNNQVLTVATQVTQVLPDVNTLELTLGALFSSNFILSFLFFFGSSMI